MTRNRLILSLLAALLPLLGTATAARAASPFDGVWCGTGVLHEFTLRLAGSGGRDIDGRLVRRDRVREMQGSVDGNLLRAHGTRVGAVVLEAVGGELRITSGEGPLAMIKGSSFRRAAGESCGS